jgi:serine/threonine-protein kinase
MSLPAPAPDWEAFYRDYRKPGYVPGFEITTKLGGGTFGLVFRARRLSIGKDYAIKFLHVEDGVVQKAVMAELEQVKWFAQIDHPNLVSIEDRGEVDGIPYLVMAFAGTETLRDRMVAGQVPSGEGKDELLRLFLQAARGLSALHERSLVHFDIKPANVFLKGSVARLGDYGLSKLVTHSRGSLSMGRGTPYYMAPELLQRRGDHRSDVYSLGVMLYEMLCGALPFTGDSEWEVLKKHESEPPVLPPHLGDRERTILMRCLAKDPAARFQSVVDLIAAFGAPAGVGEASRRDGFATAGAAAAAGKPEPPPLPGCVPPATPASPTASPAAAAREGFARASREAAQHAGVLARGAFEQAARATREAAQQAEAAIRRGLKAAAGQGDRTEVPPPPPVAPPPPPVAPPPPSPLRRRRRGHLVWPVLGIGVGLLFWGMATPMRMVPGSHAASSAGAPVGVAKPVAKDRAFHRVMQAPLAFDGLVSFAEPRWATTAERDPKSAREELVRRIAQMRQQVPLSPVARERVAQWPGFTLASTGDAEEQRDRRLVRLLAASEDYDEGIAAQLAKRAPRSLFLASEHLSTLEWVTEADLRAAHHLHRLLVEATGCEDIELAAADDVGTELARRQNKPVGVLWQWFLNEFAHTERAWRFYRRSFPR